MPFSIDNPTGFEPAGVLYCYQGIAVIIKVLVIMIPFYTSATCRVYGGEKTLCNVYILETVHYLYFEVGYYQSFGQSPTVCYKCDNWEL
jgi:hypothetical protein